MRCSAQKESTKKVNMKRENKAYSYKEQIIELELQEVKCSYYRFMYFLVVWISGKDVDFSLNSQEIKRKKGIKEELQLTSKQKEMMQMQLEKEAAIRKRLRGV